MQQTQLRKLAEPFHKKLIKQPPRGKFGVYVPHATVTERLLHVLGPFSFEVRDVIRGHAPRVPVKDDREALPHKYPARENAVVGVLATLTATVDGERVSITEVGTEDSPAMHHDAENLKNATSDAIKRCAMRLGLGLHLWSDSDYFLDRVLDKDAREAQKDAPRSGAEGLSRKAQEAADDVGHFAEEPH